MPREMLKLRKGDAAMKIKQDGQMELAGMENKSMVDQRGEISPILLFAAAWAKKDQNLFSHLVDNFKNCVREGYFGQDASDDYKRMEEKATEGQDDKKQESFPFVDEEPKVGTVTIDEGVENETK